MHRQVQSKHNEDTMSHMATTRDYIWDAGMDIPGQLTEKEDPQNETHGGLNPSVRLCL